MDTKTTDIGTAIDKRFTEIRHLDLTYSFTAPSSVRAWNARAQYLREQILTGTGLMPMPEKTPLNARVFGRIDHDDYTVEKVCFESFPGFYVTGNLYRPKGRTGPFPAVLNPHGHWQAGRLANEAAGSVPGRCINQARQGYIAFTYDMIGYNDSRQVEHRAGDLDGKLQYLWGISLGGLQLWNGIRSVDFLCSLPDVDKKRIACTGESGGGTQTFMLTAVDDRIRYAAPVNMISSTMQGGCQCENPPLIRLDTNNMEIGALAAPRPLLLVAATGDWTVNTPKVEFPAIKSVYTLLGQADKVSYAQFDAEHNYNKDSREAVYAWLGRWILGDLNASVFKEQPFDVETRENLLVFANEPKPSNMLDGAGITANRVAAAKEQLAAPFEDAEGLAVYRKTFGPVLQHALAVECPKPADVSSQDNGTVLARNYSMRRLVLARKGKRDAIPALLFKPFRVVSDLRAALVVHSGGSAALVDADRPGALVARLLDQGQTVLAIDCFNTGVHVGPSESTDRQTRYAYFETYNRTDLSERVQDVLTAFSYLQRTFEPISTSLVGVADAGLWCLFAQAFTPPEAKTVVDANGFDSSDDQAFVDKLYAPCLRRAGDIATAGAMICPGELLIHNTRGKTSTARIEEAYEVSGQPFALSIRGTQASEEDLAQWLAE